MKTNKVTYNVIQHYLEGKLEPEAMHEIEKQALGDPFLAEAIEGYSETGMAAGNHLSLLQRQLEDRIARQAENKNAFFFTWQRLSVAAAAGLMFISAGILFWMKAHNYQRRMTAPKQVEVELTPVDSLKKEVSVPLNANKGSTLSSSRQFPAQGRPVKPEPVGGWQMYFKYLKTNSRIHDANAGIVKVKFRVAEDGKLSGFEVVGGLDKARNQEAVRLIKEGPSWIPAARKDHTEVTVGVKFGE